MILIDGYNFAYKIPSFLERLYKREALTVHPEVIDLLSHYLNRHPKDRILLVWDGYPPKKKEADEQLVSDPPGKPAMGPVFFPSDTLKVQYGGDFSADFVITSYLKKGDFSTDLKVHVVSSDKELIKIAKKKKAKSILSEDFASQILDELEEELKDSPQGAQEDLAIDGWLELFKQKPK